MLFIEYLWTRPDYFICWVVVISFSICVHEFCHAFAAMKQGDDTAARNGYLTLDPRRLMGPYSLVMLAFIGFAWGAVPVNPRRMRHPWSPALVACAGPASNFFLALWFAVFLAVAQRLEGDSAVRAVRLLMTCGVHGNCLLAVFNMLPIPMLDGWSLYALWIPQLRRIDARRAQTISWIVILGIWLTPLGNVFWNIVNLLSGYLTTFADKIVP
jgi:Zn-dependent protease